MVKVINGVLACASVLLVENVNVVHAKKQPHIFLVLVDDLGWGNIGYRAGTSNHPQATTKEEAVTPNIDALAADGIKLNRHYTYNYCSPSRSSLQTGRLPVHVVVTNEEPTVHNPEDPVSGYGGIPTKMTGIAEKLKGAGYRTHMTGKWDAGMATYEQTPMGRGYETFFGYYHHANDYYEETLGVTSTLTLDVCYMDGHNIVDLWNTTGPAKGKNGTVYEEELFTENTLNVLNKHDPSEPLFLFHSFHLIHAPLEVPKEYEDKFSFLKNARRRKYAAMVHYMDTALGKFVQAFKDKGMWDDTLMILSSDNGGPIYSVGGANNIPLRGGKLVDLEGGIRVNAFVSGGYLPDSKRGTELEEYIHITDWYATLCHLAGVDPVDTRSEPYGLPPVDSLNMWPLLSGETNTSPRQDIHISTKAYIKGDYKVITGAELQELIGPRLPKSIPRPPHLLPLYGYWPGYGMANIKQYTHFKICNPGCLFNIRQDPNEKKELSKEKPELLKQMLEELAELNKSYFNPNRGKEWKPSCDVFLNKYGGYYGPFIETDAMSTIA